MVEYALLFGIPISRDGYLARIETSDYLRRYRGHPDQDWDHFYGKSVATPFCALAAKADAQGWEVQIQATLADLQRVSQTAQVIVLVSHWKNYGFPNDDFLQPVHPHHFADAVASAHGPLAQWLVQTFDRYRIGQKPSQSGGVRQWVTSISTVWEGDKTVRDILEEALDASLPNEMIMPEEGTEYRESAFTRRTRRRNVIDAFFPHLIHPGNRLELFDGLYDCATVAKAIAPHFSGVLDLTTCTSTPLADHISTVHQSRFRVVQLSQNQEPAWAATTLTATLRLLAKGYSYLEARQHAMQLVRTVAQRRIRATMESGL